MSTVRYLCKCIWQKRKPTVSTGDCIVTRIPNANTSQALISMADSLTCAIEKSVWSPPSRSRAIRAMRTSRSLFVKNHAVPGFDGTTKWNRNPNPAVSAPQMRNKTRHGANWNEDVLPMPYIRRLPRTCASPFIVTHILR